LYNNLVEYLPILFLTLVSSFFGTATGFGTSTIMVPVLAIWFPLPEVLLFVGVIHWFGDVWKIFLFKIGANWRLILLFGLPGLVASYFGASIPLAVDSTILKKVLAVFLIIYTLHILIKPKWQIAKSTGEAVTGGVLSGFLAGLLGVGGVVRGAFLEAYKLPKSTYIFTSGMIAIFIDTPRLVRYYLGDIRLSEFSYTSLVLAVVVSFIGAELAKKFVDKTPQAKFRYVVGFGLLVVSGFLLG